VTVDISTPVSFEVPNEEEFKDKYFPGEEEQVVVCFTLEIEDKELESEFLNIMSVSLVRRLLQPFAEQFGIELSEDPEGGESAAPAPAPEPEPAPASAPAASGGPLDQSAVDALLNGGGAAASPAPAASGGPLDQSAVDALLNGGAAAASAPAPAPAPAPAAPPPSPAPAPAPAAPPPTPAPAVAAVPPQPAAAPQYVQGVAAAPDPMTLQLLNQMQQSQTQMMQLIKDIEEDRKAGRNQRQGVKVQSLNSPEYGESEDFGEQEENKEMLMKVPLEISVEIGRTKKLVKDILEFTQGSLVVLDKMAGEQADLYVNGECIARGDIVVVEDNFGIRITEIVSKEINPESL